MGNSLRSPSLKRPSCLDMSKQSCQKLWLPYLLPLQFDIPYIITYLQVILQPLCKFKIKKISMRYADSVLLNIKTENPCDRYPDIIESQNGFG